MTEVGSVGRQRRNLRIKVFLDWKKGTLTLGEEG